MSGFKKINNLIIPLLAIFLFSFSFSFSGCSCGIKTQDSTTNIKEEISYEEEFTGIPDASFLSNLKIPGQAIDLNLRGDFAYLTNDLGYLYVVNIKDKSSPLITGICRDVDSANIIIVRDNYAYVSYTIVTFDDDNNYNLTCGFYIVDISDSENPFIKGNYISDGHDKKSAYGMFIDGDYAYLITSIEDENNSIGSLEIIDISIKNKPVMIGKYDFNGLPSNLWVKEDAAFINVNFYDYDKDEYEKESSVLSLDLGDKRNPELADSCIINNNSWGIYVVDDYAYISGWRLDEDTGKYDESILQIINIKDPFDLEIEGKCDLPDGPWEMASAGNYIYISILSGGFYVIDVSNSEEPLITDGLNTGGTSYDIAIRGNYGYIADGFEGMSVIKLSDKDTNKEEKDKLYFDGDNNKNLPPEPAIEVFGDTFKEKYFQIKNPVYFSARNTFDPDEDDLNYTWIIEGNECSKDESFYYYFNEPGKYDIKLIASDGLANNEKTATVNVAEVNIPVKKDISHNFKVNIEYNLINKSDKDLKDIECFMRIPQTYYPFQIVNNYITNYSDVSEILDNEWNLLLHFKIKEILGAGKTLNASATIDLSSSEFMYQDIKCTNLYYDKYDGDLEEYLMDDLFIDSDNPEIKNTAESLVRNETDPVKKAELIYNFVIKNMSYDYNRAKSENYQFLYASEILKRRSGVCSDYAILYIALLRAAGIPSRLAAGIPVYTIIHEYEKEISMGHAWVEIKFPAYGWVPFDITPENKFMFPNYYLNILTERGSGYLYEYKTMDQSNYYYDGFIYAWDGDDIPLVEQEFNFSVTGIDFNDIDLD
jgi:hypothetical protein